jgi:hypothetical protein
MKTPFKELISDSHSAWASLALNYIIFKNVEFSPQKKKIP